MKIRVVSSREEIFVLNPNERMIHLAFRPSNKDIFALVETCPKIEVIQLPKSYRRTVSKSIEMFLEMQRIQLIEGDVWGHRKDLDEYFTVEDATLNEIRSLAASGVNMDDMAAQIQKTARIGPELIKYIAMSKTTA